MDDAIVDLALVVPLHASAGIFGPSCELCAQLAVSEINAREGVLGRELRLSVVDGSGSPAEVATRSGRSPRPVSSTPSWAGTSPPCARPWPRG